MNTMADLRRLCARKMRENIHGREYDLLENNVETPHMLGIVPVGVRSNHNVEEGTILDPTHEFWDDFEENVRTKNAASKRVESAIRSLKKDGIFRMTHPYGEDADIVYCEVDELDAIAEPMLTTRCAECGSTIEVPLSLNEAGGQYSLGLSISCPHCGFARELERPLLRQ